MTAQVLVVEDDPQVLRVLSRLLELRGYQTLVAADAWSGLKLLEEHAIDVVLLDISMPVINGIEMLESIREFNSSIPVILLTGVPSVETAARAVELGALRYLLKPVDVDALLEAVQLALQKQQMSSRQSGGVGVGQGIHFPLDNYGCLSFGERLRRTDDRFFVGREEELRLFSRALSAPRWPFQLLHISGSIGVGKSALIQRYSRECAEARVPFVILETLESTTPEGFMSTLREALSLPDSQQLMPALWAFPERWVLFLDVGGAVRELQGWLRVEFLPKLPSRCLVVSASRSPLPMSWLVSWRDMIRTVELYPLTRSRSAELLRLWGVEASQVDELCDMAQGLPLALTLAVGLQGDSDEALPSVETAAHLVESFVSEIPSEHHRDALVYAALFHAVTEDALEVLVEGDAPELFEWLCRLTCFRRTSRGLNLNKLVRRSVIADARWRNPRKFFRKLKASLRYCFVESRERLWSDNLLYLFRMCEPLSSKPESAWSASLEVDVRRVPPDADHAALESARRDGPEGASWLQSPLELIPETYAVWSDDTVCGYVRFFIVPHDEVLEGARVFDSLAACIRHMGGLREGERALVLDGFAMSVRDLDVACELALAKLASQIIVEHLKDVSMLILFVHLPSWHAFFRELGWTELPEHAVRFSEHRVAPLVLDLRRLDFESALRRTLTRSYGPSSGPQTLRVEARPEPLDRERFLGALGEALSHLHNPHHFSESPLLESSLLQDTPDTRRSEALRELIVEHIEQGESDPRLGRYFRALRVGVLEETRSQEHAAELLGVSRSTFKRHVQRGREALGERLWQLELQLSREP